MNIKLLGKQLCIIVLVNLLASCGGQLIHQGEANAQEGVPNAPSNEAIIPLHPSSAEFISANQEFSYKFMVAELAGRRGYYSLSAQYFLEIAQVLFDLELAERAARLALHEKDYPLAYQATKLWLRLDAGSLQARYNLTRILIQQNRPEEAAEHLDRLLTALQDKPESQQRLILEVIEDQDQDQVARLMDSVMQKHSDNAVTLLLYARVLVGGDKLEKAQSVLEQLFTLEETNENFSEQAVYDEAVPVYIYVLSQQNKTEQALSWLKQLLGKKPDNQDWQLSYARLLAENDQVPEAITAFESLTAKDPNNEKLLYALGVLHLQMEQLTKAKIYFNRLLNVDSDNDLAYYYLAQIAELEKKPNAALAWYRQIDETSTNYLNSQARIAVLLVELDEFEQAVEHLHSISTHSDSERLSLLQFEVELYMQQERYSDALMVYDENIEQYPDNLNLRYMRAMLAEKMGHIQLLETDLRYILEIEPEHVDALNALGYSLSNHTERYDEAYQLVQKAYELEPNAYYILDSMGWVLYRKGDTDKAVGYLRKAYELKPDPEIAAHLGEVLWVSGQKEEAKLVWQQATELFPDEEQLQKVIQRFIP
ncbi:tetratricopeptide repeat protein [Candidatus Albibeggiatoa sp. nov. NOAA]|uniref:tetratricopeptide repeat protein n=1 Tax=Candidatus Albibeggiatoa sp. nov. NOAA TaxID=3162724 RepID=UPI0033037D22|nr:tetratricopeptide repeat protein [Thiotrichaceae bacterium]